MRIRNLFIKAGVALGLASSWPVVAHPLDGLTAQEITRTTELLRASGVLDKDSQFPLIELIEPAKADVLAWREGAGFARRARVQFSSGKGFQESVVNLSEERVEATTAIGGQPMVLFSEFTRAMEVALADPKMIAGLARRGLKPEQAFCLPLTAGRFPSEPDQELRRMKVPCYQNPDGSNFYAKPIEGLFAVIDIGRGEVLQVIDEGVVPVPTDGWGYTEQEVAQRVALRPAMKPAGLAQPEGTNIKFDGSLIEWDIWRFRYRVDKRPGVVLSNIDVNDQGRWRSVVYQAHLSEVFVPYMDPGQGWYWRTYMDSGEYGFGLFLSPLTPGVDCPAHATFLPVVINDDAGQPLEIPNALCVFERDIGDPAWRHFEVFAQTPDKPVPAEGRPATELIVRSASEVGNYDYLIDYRFQQNGDIRIMVGATGLDAVKGVASKSMDDDRAARETSHGTLIAPNLVAPFHDHYFNFRIDFDIDQPANHFGTMDIVRARVAADSPRRSMWTVQHTMPERELDARYKIKSTEPRYFHYMNMAAKGPLGHYPGYMIHHGSVAYGPFDFEGDPPMKRNAYIEYSVWNTVQSPNQRYAGGKFPMQSDGTDTLAQWVKENRKLQGEDIVAWFTAGFHHIPRMEDWPVMSTDWKTIHLMPHNFFAHNPALTIRGR